MTFNEEDFSSASPSVLQSQTIVKLLPSILSIDATVAIVTGRYDFATARQVTPCNVLGRRLVSGVRMSIFVSSNSSRLISQKGSSENPLLL